MERIAAVLVWSTALRRRIWRLRLVDFLVRMWRLYAPARLIEPLARTLKRLAAPRLDFILGMTDFPLFSYDAGRSCRYALLQAGRTLLKPSAITCITRAMRVLLQPSEPVSAYPVSASRPFPSPAARPSSWARAPSPS